MRELSVTEVNVVSGGICAPSVTAGTVIGGALGSAFGPIGAIAGATVGSAVANYYTCEDKK